MIINEVIGLCSQLCILYIIQIISPIKVEITRKQLKVGNNNLYIIISGGFGFR